jgi:LuxR family maltose regulon positive regulatory protein
MADLYYEGNEHEKARSYLSRGIQLCRSISYDWNQNDKIISSRILYAQGDENDAVMTVEGMLKSSYDGRNAEVIVRCTALVVEMLLNGGHHKRALDYMDILKHMIDETGLNVRDEVYLAYIRTLVYAKKQYEAFTLLANLIKELKSREKNYYMIKAYILYAEAYFLNKDHEKSDYFMNMAVRLAEENEYYRLFLDCGPIVKEILAHVKARGKFVEKILQYKQSISPKRNMDDPNADRKLEDIRRSEDQCEYTNKLSDREMDILKLIAKGLSNIDISKELFISINTTQWHISHIYSKLDVKNRTQAIIKAKELGII